MAILFQHHIIKKRTKDADKCPGITDATFFGCVNLTDATKAAVQEQHPNCRFTFP